jgi:hypothetical protein
MKLLKLANIDLNKEEGNKPNIEKYFPLALTVE